MSINLRLDVFFFHFVQCYQLNCVVWVSPPAVDVQRTSVYLFLKTCRTTPIKQTVFCACLCVYQMYLAEHVIIHPVHKKLVLSHGKSYYLVRCSNHIALIGFCTVTL